MLQKGNFLLMDKTEFRGWLQSQSLTRKIDKLQVHHTLAPNYATRKMVNGKAQQDHFACLEGMRSHHVHANKWSATGQNVTVFEDGKIAISLDRDLNKTPAGIKGANTGALCVEIIGNFDKGGDSMTLVQKEAVVHLYACLCEKLDLIPSTYTIIYHCWYTAAGVALSDYDPKRSVKSCPGTNFLGVGNTKAAASKSLIPLVKAELERLKKSQEEQSSKKNEDGEVKVTQATVVVNGKELDAKGEVKNGITYVPVRAVADAFGAKVTWDQKSATVSINK